MDNNQFEGLCSLSAVKSSGAFFNSLQVLQRDLSVLAVRVHLASSLGGAPRRSHGSWAVGPPPGSSAGRGRVLDAMCGGGVRAVRYALEGGPHVRACIAVDLNPQSAATAKLTVAHSGPLALARVEVRGRLLHKHSSRLRRSNTKSQVLSIHHIRCPSYGVFHLLSFCYLQGAARRLQHGHGGSFPRRGAV